MPVSHIRKKKNKTLPQPPKKSTHVEVKQNQNSPKNSIQQSYYQGIVPSPEMMEKYQQVSHGLPERLVKLTEDEAGHRRTIEKWIAVFGFISQILGQILAIGAVSMVCYLSYVYMMNGNPEQGKVIAVSVIVAIAGLFLGKRIFSKNKD